MDDDAVKVDGVLDQQPVAVVEAVKVLVGNVLTAAVLFGLSMSDAQVLGLLAVLNSVLALATLLIVPRRVSTKATVQQATDAGFVAGVAEGKAS